MGVQISAYLSEKQTLRAKVFRTFQPQKLDPMHTRPTFSALTAPSLCLYTALLILQAMSIFFLARPSTAYGQFVEDFDLATPGFAPQGLAGWRAATGDGLIRFTQQIDGGMARLHINAMQDQRNIWYALVQRSITEFMGDLGTLRRPDRELRMEARVRPSHGPRRINMFLFSQFPTPPELLREFDLPRAREWYTISMTTQGFVIPEGQGLHAQLSLMDWGTEEVFELDVDYIKVDVVDPSQQAPDSEHKVRYRPPLQPASSYQEEVSVSADAIVDKAYPQQVFSDWQAYQGEAHVPVLTVDAQKIVLLRWDLGAWAGKQVAGEAQLEIYTHQLQRLASSPKDFGEVRVCEIIGGSPWQEDSVSYQRLLGPLPPSLVINAQTTVDTPLKPERGGATTVVLSRPVMQRLLDGTTHGLAILPLGLINANLYAREHEGGAKAARLRFSLKP